MKSYIVFSERCELKKVPENTKEYIITKRDMLLNLIKKETENAEIIFTKEDIDKINERLISLTNVSQDIKDKHIEDINKKYKK